MVFEMQISSISSIGTLTEIENSNLASAKRPSCEKGKNKQRDAPNSFLSTICVAVAKVSSLIALIVINCLYGNHWCGSPATTACLCVDCNGLSSSRLSLDCCKQSRLKQIISTKTMGQVLGRDSSIIPYDVNGWRRLSFTYLNAITENGEIVLDENGVPVDPRTLSRSRSSLPGTPNSLRRAFGGGGGGGSRAPSRQSSFSSAKQYDTNEGSSSARASFRGGFHPERPVLQEYQPKGKTSAADWSRDGSGGGGGGGQSQRSSTRTASSTLQQHQQSVNNRGGGGRRGGDDNDDGTADTTKYADIAFAQGKYSGAGARQGPPGGPDSSHQLPPRLIIGAADQRKVRIEEDGRHRGGAGAGGEGLYSAYDSSDGRHLYSNEAGGNGNHHRAQSPKSSTTWNSSSEDQSFYSDQQQLKQIDPPSQYNHQNGVSKSSHLFPPSNGVGGGFGSRQSSGRVTTGSSSGGKSTTYLPYNDYYLDRRLRGQHHLLYNGNSSSGGGGPPTYSDFSGYSTSYHHRRNFRRRRTGVEHRPTGVAKWLFVVGALANVAATIWGSGVYLHLASKSLEIGETIQGKWRGGGGDDQ